MIATPYMKRLREGCTRWADGTYTMSDDELAAALDGPATMITAGERSVGLVVDPVPHGVQARCVRPAGRVGDARRSIAWRP